MTNRVIELLDGLKGLHAAKNSDYADSVDPYANFRECEAIGIPAWVGVVVRSGDKWRRICNLTRKEQEGRAIGIPSEPIVDSMRDLALYLLIGVALYEEHHVCRGAATKTR